MSIGDDLKECFLDVGTAFTIIRDSGNVEGEYLVYEINRQVTKPFIREFFIEAEMQYDTSVAVGDVIQFDDLRKFLVVNLSPEQLENAVIKNDAVLYKCNVTEGKICRSSGESRHAISYRQNYNFVQVESGEIHALMTSALYGHSLESDEELGEVGMENHEVYLSLDHDVKIKDRWEPFSGEFYNVDTIKSRRYSNIQVLGISEDTRTTSSEDE